MMSQILKRAAAASLVAVLALAGCGKEENKAADRAPNELNFSILAPESASSLETSWNPILADMEKSTGLKIKPFFASNYTALIEAMRFKQTDAGWFSNLPGLEAVRRADGEVFARTSDPSGEDGYRSIIIVPANSKTTLDDLLKCGKTLNFGIGDVKSTSGTMAPMTYLFAPRDIKPETCFKTVKSANHQVNMFSVANGVLDAATGNSTSLRLQKEKEAADPSATKVSAKIRVIWQSPPLPEDPIIWRKDLDPEIKEKLRQFFLTYAQGDGPDAVRQRGYLAKLSIGGFKPADDTHLLPVREMEATQNLELAKMDGDKAKIDAAQKAFAVIAAERAALEAKTGQPVR
jgi:phosphonate transport system substrate-binding protein